MTKTKLFITCKGLLWLLDDGFVEPTELDKGLYAFGCGREYLFNIDSPALNILNDESNRYGRDKHQIEMIIMEILQPAVAKAEREGRAVWRPYDKSYMPISRVNQLLAANLHRTFSNIENYDNEHYTYGGLEEIAASELPEIEVVWEKNVKYMQLREAMRNS